MRTGWRGAETRVAVRLHVGAGCEPLVEVRGRRTVETVLLHDGAVGVGRKRGRVVGLRVAVAVALFLAQFLLHALRHVVDQHGAAQKLLGVVYAAQFLDGHFEHAPFLVPPLLWRVVERRDAFRPWIAVIVSGVVGQQRQFALQRRRTATAAVAAAAGTTWWGGRPH